MNETLSNTVTPRDHFTALEELIAYTKGMAELLPEIKSELPRSLIMVLIKVVNRVVADDKAYKAEMTKAYYDLVKKASMQNIAIGNIYKAHVYEDGKLENGISLEMVAAINNAAIVAGYLVSG